MNRLLPWLLPLAVVTATAALFAPTLSWLARTWRLDPYYGHGPLLVAVALLISGHRLWPLTRVTVAGQVTAGEQHVAPLVLALILLVTGTGLQLGSLMRDDYVLSSFGFLAVLAGLVGLAWGGAGLRLVRLPLALAALAVPLPAIHLAAPPLAAAVAAAVEHAARWSGLDVTRRGAELAVSAGAFRIGAPCSGLHSLLALGSLAVLLSGLLDGAWWKRILVVAAALPLALVANGLRLLALLASAEALGADQGLRLFHGPAGPLMFLVGLAGVVAVGRLLGCEPRPASGERGAWAG